jgi:single-stranded-DNA-specific exonuclease
MNKPSKKWRQYRPAPDLASRISGAYGISPITAQVLVNRGLESDQSISSFLNPKLNALSDPRSIPGITEAAKRIVLARERGEKVAVYGDYDADGVTATAILLETFNFLNINSDHYIPHRYAEGYGLNSESVKVLKASKADLIVTVDCGISNHDEIDQANSLGMEVIVTDHHNVPKVLPNALCVANPKLIEGKHPSKDLSGAGVAFKLAWALLREAGVKDSGMIVSLLDLAALGTLADVVPLIEENRIITLVGLQVITSRSRLGLRSLIDSTNLKGNITAHMVNFVLAPRINAAGRLEHASFALDLLLSRDENKARDLASSLNKINQRRQSIGSEIQEKVFSEAKNADPAQNLLIFKGENWHPGVIGIVASRVMETCNRPAVLIGTMNGAGRGSARSMNGINIFGLLETCRDLFVDFGGHENAAGFEIEEKNYAKLKERLLAEAASRISAEDLIPKINIDAEIGGGDINIGIIKELETLAPFGKGNEEPVFMTRNLKVVSHKLVGDCAHLKARFSDGRNNLDVIGFGMGDAGRALDMSSGYDIAYSLRVSEWEGFECAELRLVDLKEAGK